MNDTKSERHRGKFLIGKVVLYVATLAALMMVAVVYHILSGAVEHWISAEQIKQERIASVAERFRKEWDHRSALIRASKDGALELATLARGMQIENPQFRIALENYIRCTEELGAAWHQVIETLGIPLKSRSGNVVAIDEVNPEKLEKALAIVQDRRDAFLSALIIIEKEYINRYGEITANSHDLIMTQLKNVASLVLLTKEVRFFHGK